MGKQSAIWNENKGINRRLVFAEVEFSEIGQNRGLCHLVLQETRKERKICNFLLLSKGKNSN